MRSSCVIYSMLLCAVASFSANSQWIKESFQVMGTQAHVEFWLDQSTSPTKSADELVDMVKQEMHRIDLAMSPYKPESELSQVNRLAINQPTKISNELMALLQDSHRISELTQGAFDITYASVGYQYDYRQRLKPDQESIKRDLQAINFRAITLNPEASTVRFNHPKLRIDLGGIAKGYAVKTMY